MSLRKKFSIVVIASREEKQFSLLRALKDKFYGHEIILVLDDKIELSLDTLNEINLNINKLIKVSESTRGKSLNAGALKAENDYLWFLHIDSQINKIERDDLDRLQKKQLGYFKLKFDNDRNKINASGANFRSNKFDLPFGDQSFLIHKNLFNLIGCFDEDIREGEDHKFVWDAKALGVEIKEIKREIITSARKYQEKSILQTFRNIFKTFTQVKKFKKKKIKNIFCFFVKDPNSKDSKSRLRDTLKDDALVDQFNLHCLKILKSNILSLEQDENKIVIVNNSKSNDYLKSFGLEKYSILKIENENIGRSMQDVYDICAPFTKNIIMSGSDIPELTAEHLIESVNFLKNYDNYIMPTIDGGYCCFSTKLKNLEGCFSRVDYTTDHVLNDFTKYLYNTKKSNFALIDVDTLSNLQKMYDVLKSKTLLSKEQKGLIDFIDKRKYS